MIPTATIQYQLIIHFATLPARARKSGHTAFATPGVWPCNAVQTEFLLMMLAATSLKKSMKAMPAAIMAGPSPRVTRTTPIFVLRFLLTATLQGFPLDVLSSAALFIIRLFR